MYRTWKICRYTCKQEVEDENHFTTSCNYTSDALFDHMKFRHSDFNDMSNRDINSSASCKMLTKQHVIVRNSFT